MAYIGNPIVSTDFPVNYFSGNGSTTAFTLSIAPASVNALDVQVSGVSQSPQTYSVSGTTLTFSTAPPSGSSNIVVRHLGVAGIPNTPSAASVVTSSIAANAVTPAKLANGGAELGYRNRIINGAMVIDQRNAGASVLGNGYPVDRWQVPVSQSAKLTAQQNAGSVTPPVGFTNYVGITSSSAYSVISTDYFLLGQKIEGYNIADLGWGTGNAKSVTLSFQVYSSLTGTFGGAVQNSSQNRSYPFSYSIPVANTWTSISVTIAGDTTGTWLTTNGAGILLWFGLGVGSISSGTAGAWAASNYNSATGATSVVGTNGATFYITGVQLEVGTTATNFDYRSIGTELALCQRYYYHSFQNGAVPASPNNLAVNQTGLLTGFDSTASCNASTTYPVNMRAAPSVTIYAPLTGSAAGNIRQSSNGTIIAGSAAFSGEKNFTLSGGSASLAYQYGYVASAEL